MDKKELDLSPLVSIITTIRNGEKYILDTLKSAYSQTYTNVEHIIVDDGSTDDSVKLIERFKKEHGNYDLHLSLMEQIGRGRALNLAVSKAKGDWIAVLDADDLWHPKKLEIQIKVLNKYKDVTGIATRAINIFNHDVSGFNNERLNIEIEDIIFSNLCRSNLIPHSSILLRKKCANYNENRDSQLDYELWFRLIYNGHKFIKTKSLLIAHRVHDLQSFESKKGKMYLWNSFKLKIQYSVKSNEYKSLIYNVAKLTYDMILPRRIRMRIRDVTK